MSKESLWLFFKIFQCLVQYFSDQIFSIRQKLKVTLRTIIVEKLMIIISEVFLTHNTVEHNFNNIFVEII